VGPPCSPGVYFGAAGLALAGIALIAYFASRERSRNKVLLLVGAGLLSAVLIVIGVELKLREEHDVVKRAAGTEVVCHHEVSAHGSAAAASAARLQPRA
jgi:hypothetical protein